MQRRNLVNDEMHVINDVMTKEESDIWYRFTSVHFDKETGKLASGLPGKEGKYRVRIFKQDYWVYFSLLYTPSRGYKGTSEGQVVIKKEMLEDQPVYFVASEQEPVYIRDHIIILPSGYRQKVRLAYSLFMNTNILKIKGRSD
jgi:hypothetical protein